MKKERTKEPLTHRLWAKMVVLLLAPLFVGLTIFSAAAAWLMIQHGFYTVPKEACTASAFEGLAQDRAEGFFINYMENAKNPEKAKKIAERYLGDGNVVGARIQGKDGILAKFGIYHPSANIQEYKCTMAWDADNEDSQWIVNPPADEEYEILESRVYVDMTLPKKDAFYWRNMITSIAYALRYWVYVIGAAALAISVWSFVFLMRGAGHRKGIEEVVPCWVTRIPGDLFLGAVGLAGFLVLQFTAEGYLFSCSAGEQILSLVMGVPVLTWMFLGTCMDLAVKIKLKTFFNTLAVVWAAKLLWKLLKYLGALLLSIGKGLPLIWKTALIYVGINALELVLLLYNWGELDNLVILWAVKNVILFPAILYAALMMRKLQKAGRALAEGDLNYQVDTDRMFLDFKTHGENLNHIGVGMSGAVEERLKSERMKTELITNVSHDLKTPLTNIINYSDLICQETCDNPKIGEYSQVLNRQSERLKRLIEDLVEASKASTGNLEVEMAPCEVGVMLIQVAGEYEERMAQSHLELVTRQPEKPVRIQADGRRLWRVFDNLMTNVCKYSQSGTRVYLTLEENQGNAVISFKNTSREPLDLTAEELMERFVRGDRSRKTEGNGLGLSIARSLTELQNGTMELMVDGDFFKVTLCFPEIDN